MVNHIHRTCQQLVFDTASQCRSRRAVRWLRLGTLWLVLLGATQFGWSNIAAADAKAESSSATSAPAFVVQPRLQRSSIRVVANGDQSVRSDAQSFQSDAEFEQQLAACVESANRSTKESDTFCTEVAVHPLPNPLPSMRQAVQMPTPSFDERLLNAGEFASRIQANSIALRTNEAPFSPPAPEQQPVDIASMLQATQPPLPTADSPANTPIGIKISVAPTPPVAFEPVWSHAKYNLPVPAVSQISIRAITHSPPATQSENHTPDPAHQLVQEPVVAPVEPKFIDSEGYSAAVAAAFAAGNSAETHISETTAGQPPIFTAAPPHAAPSEPVVADVEPSTAPSAPETASNEPMIVASEPAIAASEPAIARSEPTIAAEKPFVAAAAPTPSEPGIADAQPATTQCQPIVNAAELYADAVAQDATPSPTQIAARQPELQWSASNFAATNAAPSSEIHVNSNSLPSPDGFIAALAQATTPHPSAPSPSTILPTLAGTESVSPDMMSEPPMPLTNSSYLPANPENYCYRCGVQCPNGGCQPGGPDWAATRPIPWEVFAQGEYIGPARLAHVPIYRLRVDDSLAFVYRLSGQVANQPYRLNVRDRIQVQSLSAPEVVNREVFVQPDGTITLPLIGQVRAAGATLDELSKLLDDKFKSQIKDPRITVAPLVLNSNLEELRSSVDRRYGQGGQVSDARVSPDGTIQLPAVGCVPAQGMTLAELEREVKARYARIVEGLEVTPILLNRAPRFIYVVGEVKLPGRYTMEGPTTLMQAITLAGSWNVGAQTNNVVVFRRDENWQLMATRCNVRSALLFKKPCPTGEIWLRDSDIVLVPKSPILCADDVIELVFTRGIYGVFPMTAQLNFAKLSTL
jgi:polysaccharide biosynthesis/export protein